MKVFILALALMGASPLMAQQPDAQEMKTDVTRLANSLCECHQIEDDKAAMSACLEKLSPAVESIDNKYREWSADPKLRSKMLEVMLDTLEGCELKNRELLDNLLNTLRNTSAVGQDNNK